MTTLTTTLAPFAPQKLAIAKPNLLTFIDLYLPNVPVMELDTQLHHHIAKAISNCASIDVVIEMLYQCSDVLKQYNTNTDQHMVIQTTWAKIKTHGTWRHKQLFNQFINSLNN